MPVAISRQAPSYITVGDGSPGTYYCRIKSAYRAPILFRVIEDADPYISHRTPP